LVQFLFAPFKASDPCGTPFTVRQCINLHKLLVPVVYVLTLHFFADEGLTLTGTRYGPAAMVIMVTHTVYGLAWVYKDVHFPDYNWLTPMTFLGFLLVFVYPLGMYYLPMYCLVTQHCGPTFGFGDELGLVGIGLAFNMVGFFYHFCGDNQKYFQLKYQRPRGLITDGLFAHCRNPNYFGEIMLYTGWAIMSMSWLVWPAFLTAWLIIFWPNMLNKEASMSRYQQFAAWKARTGFVIPWLPTMVYDMLINGLNRGGIPEEDKLLA